MVFCVSYYLPRIIILNLAKTDRFLYSGKLMYACFLCYTYMRLIAKLFRVRRVQKRYKNVTVIRKRHNFRILRRFRDWYQVKKKSKVGINKNNILKNARYMHIVWYLKTIKIYIFFKVTEFSDLFICQKRPNWTPNLSFAGQNNTH